MANPIMPANFEIKELKSEEGIRKFTVKAPDGREYNLSYKTNITGPLDDVFKSRVANMVSLHKEVEELYKTIGKPTRSFSVVSGNEGAKIRHSDKPQDKDIQNFISTKQRKYSATKPAIQPQIVRIQNIAAQLIPAERPLQPDEILLESPKPKPAPAHKPKPVKKGAKVNQGNKADLGHGVTLSLKIGNIVDSKAHYIANAANEDFDIHGDSTVAGGVYNAGGGDDWTNYQTEKGKHPHGKIKTGEVYCITPHPGSKLAKNGTRGVLHGAGPDFNKAKADANDLYLVYKRSLMAAMENAQDNNVQPPIKIAFPVISSGVFKGDKTIKELMECAMQAINEFVSEKKDDLNVEIEFYVLSKDERYNAINNIIKQCK